MRIVKEILALSVKDVETAFNELGKVLDFNYKGHLQWKLMVQIQHEAGRGNARSTNFQGNGVGQ